MFYFLCYVSKGPVGHVRPTRPLNHHCIFCTLSSQCSDIQAQEAVMVLGALQLNQTYETLDGRGSVAGGESLRHRVRQSPEDHRAVRRISGWFERPASVTAHLLLSERWESFHSYRHTTATTKVSTTSSIINVILYFN